jgi:type VI secretion system protein ImpH
VTKHQEHQHGDAWRMSFTTLLRRISAKRADLPAVGEAQRPVQEAFKIGQTASLAFAPREIDSITQEDHLGSSKTNIKLFGLGMLGPNGPLPLHYTSFTTVRSRTNIALGVARKRQRDLIEQTPKFLPTTLQG